MENDSFDATQEGAPASVTYDVSDVVARALQHTERVAVVDVQLAVKTASTCGMVGNDVDGAIIVLMECEFLVSHCREK